MHGKSALKVLLGLLFIVSAALKLIEIDHFEIYVYSYHYFNLDESFLVARLAIIIELVLGIGLISHCLHKLIWWGCMAMLAGYSLLLIYALHIGRTDSCHCFGEFLQFDPKESLIKNGVLMLLFLLIYRMESWKTSFRWLILCLAVLASTFAVFLISPPDNMSSVEPEQNLQMEVFNGMLDEAPLESLNLRDGKQIVCFFSTGCELCQMAARKLSLMQRFYGFPNERITYIFMGSKEAVKSFYKQSESSYYRNVLYTDLERLLKAVNGNFPVLVFMDNGVAVHEYGFRDMDEEEIKSFMQ